MPAHVDLTKSSNENTANLVRRFTKLFRSTGIAQEVRGRRYFSRKNSALKKKSSALRRLELSKKYDMLRKLGKIS
jgi:ribosomal protein S21